LLKQGPLRADVRPDAFHFLVASPGDVTVLRKPSWWTAPRILAAVGAILLVAMAALLWVIVPRYRIAIQTGIIRRQLARETVYEERGRIARQLHDTLEQELVGISLQLDTVSAKLPEAADGPRQLLDLARLLLRHSRAEARRSIMDLRASLLEGGDLASALQTVAARSCDGQRRQRRGALAIPLERAERGCQPLHDSHCLWGQGVPFRIGERSDGRPPPDDRGQAEGRLAERGDGQLFPVVRVGRRLKVRIASLLE